MQFKRIVLLNDINHIDFLMYNYLMSRSNRISRIEKEKFACKYKRTFKKL